MKCTATHTVTSIFGFVKMLYLGYKYSQIQDGLRLPAKYQS